MSRTRVSIGFMLICFALINTAFIPADVQQDSTASQTQGTELTDTLGTPPPITEIISVPKIFWTIVFLIVGYIVIRILIRILDIWAERSTKYRIMIKGFIPITRIFGWSTIIFIIVASIIQPPLATILAFSASIGVAVGFASQDILKNVFGGITILFDRPFNVGDKIEIGNYYGEVIEIGLRSTRIVTPDDSMVTIPNGELMKQLVSNSNSGYPYCQVVAEIYLPVNVETNEVKRIAIEAAQVSNYVYLDKPIVVLFSHHINERNSYLKMKLKAYVSDIRNEFVFKSDLTQSVIKALIKANILTDEFNNPVFH